MRFDPFEVNQSLNITQNPFLEYLHIMKSLMSEMSAVSSSEIGIGFQKKKTKKNMITSFQSFN